MVILRVLLVMICITKSQPSGVDHLNLHHHGIGDDIVVIGFGDDDENNYNDDEPSLHPSPQELPTMSDRFAVSSLSESFNSTTRIRDSSYSSYSSSSCVTEKPG